MRQMSSTEIRNMWFKFFESKGHKILESAPLVPIDDDSLLFINAGVAPLKKYFDGSVVPDNKRLSSVQKCIRTNDIDNVGVTKRHQTFFEMMGNFSIGDYFKNEALEFAFELLTGEEWFAIPKEKIYVTVYSKDDEAFNKWVSLGLDPSHIARLEGNFWEIGEGPCGPDSEIFFDRGSEYDDGNALAHFMMDEDQERYVEIWNNVFSQFNSKSGMSRDEYPELPNKNIDTGAGLERWCCIFQGVDSNFETDLFVPLIKRIEELTGKEYHGEMPYKVIADHIRAITMALTDGAIFENTGRGYVLRRLLRRSVRMGKKLGMNEPFIYKLVDTVAEIMGESYKEVEDGKGFVKTLVLQEEELFYKTLEQGERRLLELIEESVDKTISGYDAFKLYDTYGFPFELTLEYLQEVGFTTSREEFDKYMTEAKQLAKSNRKDNANMNIQNEALLNFHEESTFLYGTYETNSKVIGLFDGNNFVNSLDKSGYIVLDKTCFYATSGGQVNDIGTINNSSFDANVIDVIKAPNGQHLHKVELNNGIVSVGDECFVSIDKVKRDSTARNHSSVHILQKSLQEVLSNNIHQAGSYVDNERLRFDFTFTGKIMENEIIEVERVCNEKILQNNDVVVQEMSLDEAKKLGAMALFSEKYKDVVRVVTIGDSIELCGGTHVSNTSDINRLAIVKLESKGSNVYRIEAATNDNISREVAEVIKNYVEEIKKLLDKAKNILELAKEEGIALAFDVVLEQTSLSSYQDIISNKNQLEYIQKEVKELEKKYNEEKLNKSVSNLDSFLNSVEDINNQKVIIAKVDNYDMEVLKGIIDNLMVKLEKGLVFIANVHENNVNFVCRSNISTPAGLLVKNASIKSLGNGGGSPTFAQGGGKTIEFLDEIFNDIKNEIK
ncbi:MAG: alanine--tRNA ligase [Bacilli bacterium]|nr:alanine--tRNA ligase [Bacilli bacterium]